jgi:xanthine dehydrogenase YagR molybdenum-binding subunit
MPDIIGQPIIGQPLDRVDGRLRVTGRATYTADYHLPDMAHAVLLTSTIAKGQILSVDHTAALKVRGVLAVISNQNAPKLAKDPAEVQPGAPADRVLQVFQHNRVLYANQPVAVAVAETLEAAREAASLIRVRYAAEKPIVNLEAGMPNSYIPPKVGGGGDPGNKQRGSFDQGMREAEMSISEVYRTAFHTHNPLEPHATLAAWDDPDRLTLYDCSQGIFGDRKRMAELFGLQPEDVHVITLFLGGGFGSKGPTWSHSVICAMAARIVGRPVKLVLRRPQMFGPVGFRSETRQAIALGAKLDGALTAVKNDTTTHTSTFDEFAETATLPSRMLYATPNNWAIQRLVRSDIGTPSYTRAPGEAPGTFSLEVAMDELAYKLNIDPIELRLKNYAEHDQDKELPWSTKSLRECYQRGAERFGWAKRPMQPRSLRDGNVLIGWGMATAVYPARRSPASARARWNPDGSVIVEAGTQDLGGGTQTIMTQVAADTLGVPVSKVTFRLGDTKYPETPVSGGSQTAATAGTAVYQAISALKEAVVEMSGGAPAEIVVVENEVVIRREGTSQTLKDLLAKSGRPYVEAQAKTQSNDAKKYASYSFGAQFAEVRVDADLGQIFVSRMVGVFAPGRILNAKTARSQFMGGMIWGISLALLETTVYDERLGRIVNNNLAEYHVPTNADVGQLDISWVEEFDPQVSPIGAKGIGEIGITGSAAAVANAIFHATGRRVRETPITPDKLI